jgi:hypothetical protein
MNKEVGRTKKDTNFQYSSGRTGKTGRTGRTHQNQTMQNDLTT